MALTVAVVLLFGAPPALAAREYIEVCIGSAEAIIEGFAGNRYPDAEMEGERFPSSNGISVSVYDSLENTVTVMTLPSGSGPWLGHFSCMVLPFLPGKAPYE